MTTTKRKGPTKTHLRDHAAIEVARENANQLAAEMTAASGDERGLASMAYSRSTAEFLGVVLDHLATHHDGRTPRDWPTASQLFVFHEDLHEEDNVSS